MVGTLSPTAYNTHSVRLMLCNLSISYYNVIGGFAHQPITIANL